MKKTFAFLFLSLALFIFTQCRDPAGIQDSPAGIETGRALIGETPQEDLPENFQILNATLHLYTYVMDGTPETGIYAVTGEWTDSEATWAERQTGITWNTPGGDYDPQVLATLAPEQLGWVEVSTPGLVDIVTAWYRDPVQNHGLLLRQTAGTTGDILRFLNSTWDTLSYRPYLEIEYTDGETTESFVVRNTETENCVFETNLWERPGYTTENFNDWHLIDSGYTHTYLKHGLIRFELPVLEIPDPEPVTKWGKKAAWLRVNDSPEDPTHTFPGDSGATYIYYDLSGNGALYYLYTADNFKVGEVSILHDFFNLYIQTTLLEGFQSLQSVIDLSSRPERIPHQYNWNPDYQLFPYQNWHFPILRNYTFTIPIRDLPHRNPFCVMIYEQVIGDFPVTD